MGSIMLEIEMPISLLSNNLYCMYILYKLTKSVTLVAYTALFYNYIF